ncbi:5-oxoprolinase/urea amidolyase family protein [Georgenia sp. MJ206]|uniref:5-oxoprolinase subunit B/C family protein n=1 Tax=Georgenia wangjunii TaxID=3117730 RepID=UPI002F26D07E
MSGRDGGLVDGGARTVRPVGERAFLVECRDLDEVLALHAALLRDPVPGQLDVLAAARTVLVRLADRRTRDRAAAVLASFPAPPPARTAGRLVVIETLYDGPDLAAVGELTGLAVEEVVARHTAGEWVAAFGGFAPGFAYLVSDGPGLSVPRRESPRTAVPAGSVALAGEFSAVYPRRSPGGWQLIGRTGAAMWDLDREPPALVRPGDRVRFRAVRELVTAGRSRGDVPSTRGPDGGGVTPSSRGAALAVVATGPLSLVEDLGRPGLADLGVSPSGALDRGAAVQANRLVGNDREAAVIETVLGGLELQAHGSHVLAVSGAPAPLTVLVDGAETWRPPLDAPFPLGDGEVVRLGSPATGFRSYVAVRGGVAVRPVLGSRSTDVLSGTGPPPLAAGDVLPVGEAPRTAVGRPEPARTPAEGVVEVGVVPGPRRDWLSADARTRFLAEEWTVTERSNRVGLRLDGEPLTRAETAELPSEGTVAGAVQVPADGRPVVFLADHPVTGGYPVVAVVREADRDMLAQVRPGERVRFVMAPEDGVRDALEDGGGRVVPAGGAGR